MLVAEKITNNYIIEDRREQEQINNRRVSYEKQKKLRVKMVFAGVSILTLILCNLAIHALVIRQNYFIKTWSQQIAEKEQEVVMLRMEIAELESFDRIQQIAQNELGMKQTEARDLYVIQSNAILNDQLLSTTVTTSQVDDGNGVWAKITDWLGGFGKTMAKN